MARAPESYRAILDKLGIEQLNPMQLEMWEEVQKRQSVVLESPTGTGKTLAFLLPIFSKLNVNDNGLQILIIAPTRELAMQIHSVAKSIGRGYQIALCYGGSPIRTERTTLERGVQVVIGTPGRILDHLSRGFIIAKQLKSLVLDEWDKILEMGFQEEIMDILRHTPKVDQYILTSATRSIQVPNYIPMGKMVRIDYCQNEIQNERLQLYKVPSPSKDKIETLGRLLDDFAGASTLVFLNHRDATERTHRSLINNDVSLDFFHGGLDQKEREIKLLKFRNGSIRTLVTTDLIARGLDISLVENVVHYHLPIDREQFIHRNGRTARMNAEGNAYVILFEGQPEAEYVNDFSLLEYELGSATKVELPEPAVTLRISKGKKDKVNKIDILGFLTKVCGLPGSSVGIIDVKPYESYVAIPEKDLDLITNTARQKKLKGRTVRFRKV